MTKSKYPRSIPSPAYNTVMQSFYNSPVTPSTNVNEAWAASQSAPQQQTSYYQFQDTQGPLNVADIADSITKSYANTAPPTMTMNTPTSDIADAANKLPIIPSFDPVSTIWNIAAIGLKLFGASEQSDAERKQAEVQQKYYNDLATFEEKQAEQSSFQISLKSTEVGKQSQATIAAQQTIAAGSGYAGSSLEEVATDTRLNAQIDKAIIKQAAAQTVQSGFQKAAQYRTAGQQAYEAGMKSADTGMFSAISNIGMGVVGNILGKGTK